MSQNTEISKYVALILRHKPEKIGIQLDKHDWAKANELITRIQEKNNFSMDLLEQIVR